MMKQRGEDSGGFIVGLAAQLAQGIGLIQEFDDAGLLFGMKIKDFERLEIISLYPFDNGSPLQSMHLINLRL